MSEIEIRFGKTLVVVAHPDDEVIACGILLQRLRHATVAFLTDGAPADPYFWGKFRARTKYADLRAAEARRALESVKGISLASFGARDQELMFHLDAALEWLRGVVDEVKPQTIVTHAYEGGHPDHDCCSFLCWLTARETSLPVWEIPLYSRVGGKLVRQHLPATSPAITLSASNREQERKAQMVTAYESQAEFLQSFDLSTEKLMPQPQHDYAKPPHSGKLNYECWGWEIAGSDLCAAFGRVTSTHLTKRAKSA